MPEVRKRFVIIDGKSVFYRGYYAMPNLKTKDGIPTGGVYGFTAMALEVLKKLNRIMYALLGTSPKLTLESGLNFILNTNLEENLLPLIFMNKFQYCTNF
jgi:hypothetical protein